MRILDKNRSKYKHAFSDNGSCAFCERKDPLECDGLSGKHWYVRASRFPYMDGNVMIIPVRHVEKTEELNNEEWSEFGKVLLRTQEVLKKAFKTDSFNLGLNIGPESGASIAHLHWQVIPRKFKNITVANTFADLYLIGVTPEETKRMIDEATVS
jgi:diadenosine tetraphosphate (Ap4A) HIT family hydrolase